MARRFRPDPPSATAGRAEWLAHLKDHAGHLQEAPDGLKTDRQFILEAIECNESAFLYVCPTLQADPEIALSAVRRRGGNLGMLPRELREDREIVAEAVRQDGTALQFAPGLGADRPIVLDAVHQNHAALQFAAKQLQADREVVLCAVRQNGLSLAFAALQLKADREIVIEAVRQNRSAIQLAAGDLPDDPILQASALARNRIASQGANAPTFDVSRMSAGRDGSVDVVVARPSGDEVTLNLGQRATLGDLAIAVVEHFAVASGHVHLVTGGDRVSPASVGSPLVGMARAGS